MQFLFCNDVNFHHGCRRQLCSWNYTHGRKVKTRMKSPSCGHGSHPIPTTRNTHQIAFCFQQALQPQIRFKGLLYLTMLMSWVEFKSLIFQAPSPNVRDKNTLHSGKFESMIPSHQAQLCRFVPRKEKGLRNVCKPGIALDTCRNFQILNNFLDRLCCAGIPSNTPTEPHWIPTHDLTVFFITFWHDYCHTSFIELIAVLSWDLNLLMGRNTPKKYF